MTFKKGLLLITNYRITWDFQNLKAFFHAFTHLLISTDIYKEHAMCSCARNRTHGDKNQCVVNMKLWVQIPVPQKKNQYISDKKLNVVDENDNTINQMCQMCRTWWGHTCKPSYSGGRDQKDQAKKLRPPTQPIAGSGGAHVSSQLCWKHK
jgi:hypothetical protein